MRLAAHGFDIDLPEGWEGAVTLAEVDDRVQRRARQHGREVTTQPVVHLSTQPLPAVRGDFGSGAVDLLQATDLFIAVVEYGPESLGTALFSESAMPRKLVSTDFSATSLQRTLDGQCGFQRFCTEQGRALCLYVVLGSTQQAGPLARAATQVLRSLQVSPAGGAVGPS